MPTYQFETPRPVQLFAEIGKGLVTVSATDGTTTQVEILGRDADQVQVRQDGDQISVIGPKGRAGFFGGDSGLDVTVTVPTHSNVVTRTGSANIVLTGTFGTAQLRSGSGDIAADVIERSLAIETGSGDIRVDDARSDAKVKTGSGDILFTESTKSLSVSTGSGDVHLRTIHGPSVVKTGSGDLEVGDARADVTLTTGSGSFTVLAARRGRMTAKCASGDVRVGVPAGLPVWTDISTVSGEIRSNLTGAGAPTAGGDHVEVRAKTVSGDVVLTEV